MSQRWTRERVKAMYALYDQGKTMEQVGAAYNLTRQRVAQLFKEHGFVTRSTAETAALKSVRIPDEQIIDLYKEYGSIDAVLEHIDISRAIVANVVAEIPNRENYQRRRQDAIYSTDDYCGALRKAAQLQGEPLTIAAYRDAAKELDLPSFGALLNHFKTEGQSAWERALTLAGVTGTRTFGPRQNSITPDECTLAVAECIVDLGERPTYMRYCSWAKEHDRISGPTVRNKMGWNTAVEDAYEKLEGISA